MTMLREMFIVWMTAFCFTRSLMTFSLTV